MKPSDSVHLVFGPFRFDPKSGLLFEGGAEVTLPPRAAAILTSLLETPGEMVSKEELIEAGWGDTAVSDQSLTEAVKLLRQALHDDPKDPAYIHTLRRRGYRFIAPVSAVPKDGPGVKDGPAPEIGGAPAPVEIGTTRAASRRRFSVLVLVLVALAIGGAWFIWTFQDRLAWLEQRVGRILGPGISQTQRRVWADEAEFSGSVSPDGKYVAYVGTESPSPQLWLYEEDGTATGRRTQLTRYEWPQAVHRDGRAVFSRDGRRIAYIVINWTEEVYEMHVLTLDGRYALDDSGAADSAALASDSATADADAAVPGVLRDVSVHRGRWMVAHDWTRDGKSVLAARPGDEGVEIVLIPAEGDPASARPEDIRVLKTLVGVRNIGGPRKISLSPDDRTIAYDVVQGADTGHRDIHVWSLDDEPNDVVVAAHPFNDHSPLWTPDGQALVFLSNREGQGYSAWTVRIAAGVPGPAELKARELGWSVRLLGLTADGSLYYGSGYTALGKDIYVAPLEPGTWKSAGEALEVQPVVAGQNIAPAWSPDGTLLAHVSERGPVFVEPGVVVFSSVDGSQGSYQRDIKPPLLQIRQTGWSPDGLLILARARELAGPRGFYLIDVTTGDVERVVRGSDNFRVPRWSADGKAVFYWRRSRETGRSTGNGTQMWTHRVLRHDLSSPEGAEDQEIYRVVAPNQRPVSFFRPSPDGQRIGIYLVTSDGDPFSWRILTIPAAGGDETEVWSESDTEWWISDWVWTPDSKGILFVKATTNSLSDERELWHLDLESGDTGSTGISAPGLQTIAVDPEGRRIAFTGGTQAPSANVWVLLNFLDRPTTGGR